MVAVRREHDFYPTPSWATKELLKRIHVRGVVLEPCVGKGDIARVLLNSPDVVAVPTNDLDRAHQADSHFDATDNRAWGFGTVIDWTVTNPPFTVAHKILPLALRHSRVGVAMLLRLTYLEPCEGRGLWLEEYPPEHLIVLPRISFTGDGDTDSVTCAWMVWSNGYVVGQRAIQIVCPVDERQGNLLEASA